MSRTLQFRRLGAATLANTIGANGELIINTTNKTLTVHDGSTPGGFALLNSATDFDIDQYARNTANTATSNITILQGVNATQNTNITSVNNFAQNAYNKANAAYDYANTIVSDTQIDPFARQTANAAFNKANVANDLAQSAYNYANTISATGIDQYARDTANTSQAVNLTQNTNITFATTLAQNAYNNSNTKFSSSGGQITGNVIIVGDLDVTDNTVVTNAVEANNIIIDGTLKTGLAARTSVVLPHLIAQFASNSASYVQTNSQNINPEGSADWVVTADNGTDTDYYIDMGLHGSQAYDGIISPYDGYLYVQGSTIGQAGGNLIIGTTSSFPGLETMFVSGGYQFQNNIVMRVGSYGANVIGDLIVTGQIIGPTINAISGGGVTGNISVLATNSAINFVANSSGDGVGYSTIQLVPDTNATQDQYIVIDPTAPSHIHIRAGGVQDSSGAQLFLGGEKHYVRVTDNQGIRLQNEELSDNYYYYEQNNQYVSGIWYEESGNYFIQFTTDNGQMVNDLSNFANGSPNEVILYWNNGVETISNTMISVSGFWQGMGNVYTAQVSATLPANNTTLTAIEFHLFTTRINFLILENNDFTVDVTDDVRINARDYFSLRNWSTTDPIEIVTDYDANAWTWSFNTDKTLRVPGAVNFQQNSTIPLGPPVINGTNDRVRLWDFEGAGSGYNYAIGAEGNHIWFSMDVDNGTGGFKFYSRDNQVFKIRDDGALLFADGSIQTMAANTGNVTFNDITIQGVGNEYGGEGLYLSPDPALAANLMYFRVRGGDTPTHLHFDTGDGNIYDQYFGDDGKYLKLEAGNQGNVIIGVNGTGGPISWQFNNNGTLTFPTGNVQTGAAISITELKALVANCATYGDFQTAIAAL